MGQCFDLESRGGGGKRDRTDDPLLAKQVLYQLSYAPIRVKVMVGLGGLEPPTPRLSSVCSNQLSYKPMRSLLSIQNQSAGLCRLLGLNGHYFSHLFTVYR